MGSSASKVARRQYPSASSIPSHSPSSHAPPSTSKKPEFIGLDGRDPGFSSRLSRVGPVEPLPSSPTNQNQFPPSWAQQGRTPSFPAASPANNNPALRVVQAREAVGKRWEEENAQVGRASFAGRTLVSAATVREVLAARGRGVSAEEVERKFGLKGGLVQKLGAAGLIVGNA